MTLLDSAAWVSSVTHSWTVAVFRVHVDDEGNAVWKQCRPPPGVALPEPISWRGNEPVRADYLLNTVKQYAESVGLPFIKGIVDGSAKDIPTSPLELLAAAVEEDT